jgi:PAS domain S-box-containing protein
MFVTADGRPSDTIRQFDALIENFPDMIHSVDEKGNIVYVNFMATLLLGYTKDELCSMNIRQLYPPEILEAVEKGFREVKQTGEKRVESLFMAHDGTRIPVELRTLVIRDEKGEFARTFTISRDIRKLKEMQESLIHAGRLAAIGELAAGVVHDLNNPLTAVILASTVMKTMADSPHIPPEEMRVQTAQFCETISESAATMEHLTTRLRDFARGVKEQHTPVDLFDPIHDALFILAHRIKSNQIQVSCPFVKAKHWVLGDRNQIEQVFLNLFANACDAMAQSERRELSVDIAPHTYDGKPFWLCSVADSGEGISEQEQQQVFKAFHTTKPRGKGTGLGLSIARSILKEHSGEIQLASERGKGATFSVFLPAFTPLIPSGGAGQ